MSRRSDLYPSSEPIRSGMLPVGDGHALYWEESGNPNGMPAIFLHGGPGAGATPTHRRFFDPRHYRIVIFDQRGANRSTPLGNISANTTRHLIDDIETLRTFLHIDSWLVFGGSWGSTLALAYAERHPHRVRAMVLRGIFLGGRAEIDWFMRGMQRFFPEAWRQFVAPIPETERHDLLDAFYRRLVDPDPSVHLPAARAWSTYEAACSTLLPNPDGVANFAVDRSALGLARIEAHFFKHDVFLEPGQLLHAIDRFRHVPTTVVQGRYDVICPPGAADALCDAWPEADYQIIPDAGHAAMEPGIRTALIAATDRYRALR